VISTHETYDFPVFRPVTSQSINSPAIVKDKILQEYRIHWFLGLRQAELFVQDRLKALNYTKSQLALLELTQERRDIQIQRIKLTDYSLRSGSLSCDLDRQFDEIAIKEIQIEVAKANTEIEDIKYQVRDAVAELKAALKIRETISSEHAEELESMNFDELQEAFGDACIDAKQAHCLSSQIGALIMGGDVISTLTSISPDRLDSIFDLLNQKHRSNLSKFSGLIQNALPLMVKEETL
jgi:hypothetical protein